MESWHPTSGRLLLSRHGQTEHNATLRFQGQADVPLNDFGRQQAALLGRRLEDEAIDAAYSSDLLRARETAEIALGSRAHMVRLDPRLRESGFGRWEGLTYAEIQERFPEDVVLRDRDRVNFAIPGGESLRMVADRVLGFMQAVLPGHEGQSVLLVCHGGTLNAIIATLLSFPLTSWWRLRNHNANVTIIEFGPDGPRLASFNDTCHLESLAVPAPLAGRPTAASQATPPSRTR